jgi:23S rRNA pseudouridine1911/1915/1917 synthase
MTEIREIVVAPEHSGSRLDHTLKALGLVRGRAQAAGLVAAGAVRVNGKRAIKGQLLRAGDRISLEPARVQTEGPGPDAELALRVVYEDAWLVVVDKPAGVPSHALRPAERGTIASALLARYPEMADVGHRVLEPGLLHRLDTDTSGLLLAARDPQSFARLREAHRRGEFDKRYLALCQGELAAPQAAHAYLRADRRKVRVRLDAFPQARPIETALLSCERRGAFSLVEVRVGFAARHQVRAHLAALGHPIANDPLYGGPSLPGLMRHFLHASTLELTHPQSGERLRLEAPLPHDLTRCLASLGT